MEGMGITLKREDLYEKVWQKPMSRLAPEYRLSDVGLKKICKKLKVPTPPRGYWVKLRHGYKIPVTPLPKLKFADPETYYLQEPSSNKTNRFRASRKIILSLKKLK